MKRSLKRSARVILIAMLLVIPSTAVQAGCGDTYLADLDSCRLSYGSGILYSACATSAWVDYMGCQIGEILS